MPILSWSKKYGKECEGSDISVDCLRRKEAEARVSEDANFVPPIESVESMTMQDAPSLNMTRSEGGVMEEKERTTTIEERSNAEKRKKLMESFQTNTTDLEKDVLKRIEYRGEDEAA